MTQRHLQAIPLTRARAARRLGLALGAAACTVALAAPGVAAWADDNASHAIPRSSSSSPAQVVDEKIEVDLLADELAEAKAGEAAASVKACSMQARAEALKAMEPLQKDRSMRAARQLYKAQQGSYGIVDMLARAQSLEDFIQQGEYYQRVTEHNIDEIMRLKELNAQISEAEKQADAEKADAKEQVAAAAEALLAAQQERADRAVAGVMEAQTQAVTLGGSKSVTRLLSEKEIQAIERGEKVEEPKPVAEASSEKKSKASGKKGSNAKEEKIEYSEPAMTDTAPLDAGVNWFMSREEFLAEWTPRLDAYLAGSPLEGQGANFAKSAWRHGIDPRWSAAISNTESSKASFCIRPHNAWGWGAADSDPYGLASQWDSWEEAIEAHTSGLSSGYGYTITIRGAQTYCPYNWQSWYNNTLTEMARI